MSENIRRRTIVKGAAWSLPVIATTVILPATTASSPLESCMRFIGTNLVRKGVKVKIQNQCDKVVRNVVLMIGIVGEGHDRIILPIGDIPPHGHYETESGHIDLDVPESVSVVIAASADNATRIMEVLR